jgi:hypothetical protein
LWSFVLSNFTASMVIMLLPHGPRNGLGPIAAEALE